ncbi:acyl-CoA thioesterase [Pseudidiomarina marina]|uniref:acyl-CoA thioesterase n=1 Tax=Pseudidiomarina marina TaxID=502366 RepID=UPI00384E01C8
MKPSELPFCEVIRVRFSDTDSQGHLYFANYLVYADEAVCQFMEELGYSAMNPQQAPCLIYMVNIQCDYLRECQANEDVHCHVGYSRLGSSSADVVFELTNAQGEMLAKGQMTQVFVNKETRKAAGIPSDLRAAIINQQPELAD